MTTKKMTAFAAAVMLICAVSAISHAQERIRYDGSAPIGKLLMPRAAEEFEKKEKITFDLHYKTTGYGIEKLLSGECDIAGGTRALEPSEKDKGLVEIEICLDGYVFIVHESNPIKQIASEQIEDIFKGKITAWDDIGGPKGNKITVISPPPDTGYYLTAKKTIGFNELPENAMQVNMTTEVYTTVKAYPFGIGLTSHADIMDKKDVKLLEILHKGKRAKITQTHIYFGTYPYRQSLYMFTKGEPAGNVKKFIEFFSTKEGKNVIMASGFFLLPPK